MSQQQHSLQPSSNSQGKFQLTNLKYPGLLLTRLCTASDSVYAACPSRAGPNPKKFLRRHTPTHPHTYTHTVHQSATSFHRSSFLSVRFHGQAN